MDHIGHAAHGGLVARGGGDTVAMEKAAIGGEGGDLGFGAAEVDADADLVGRAHGRMVRRCGVWLKAGDDWVRAVPRLLHAIVAPSVVTTSSTGQQAGLSSDKV